MPLKIQFFSQEIFFVALFPTLDHKAAILLGRQRQGRVHNRVLEEPVYQLLKLIAA